MLSRTFKDALLNLVVDSQTENSERRWRGSARPNGRNTFGWKACDHCQQVVARDRKHDDPCRRVMLPGLFAVHDNLFCSVL